MRRFGRVGSARAWRFLGHEGRSRCSRLEVHVVWCDVVEFRFNL